MFYVLYKKKDSNKSGQLNFKIIFMIQNEKQNKKCDFFHKNVQVATQSLLMQNSLKYGSFSEKDLEKKTSAATVVDLFNIKVYPFLGYKHGIHNNMAKNSQALAWIKIKNRKLCRVSTRTVLLSLCSL